MNNFIKISCAIVLLLIIGCDQSYSPKPRGYFRIDLPEKTYIRLSENLPYSFEYPAYANITPDYNSPGETSWINVEFPGFNGSLHISYKAVNNDLNNFIEDSRALVQKHIPKANAIRESLIMNESKRVFGLVYEIDGKGAASPMQFYVTDSTTHFLRGALYFNVRPNNDSLAPVIDFLKADIQHLINTLEWQPALN
ncbi:MAG: gliding motility lipoprotein GldD [Bacteroidales bacterium]|nr:gliding motility lipoprotein GldD [Bacteroidales bacterium]